MITGSGAAFSGGADVTEFGSAQMVAAPSLARLCPHESGEFSKAGHRGVERHAMGGGLKFAMAVTIGSRRRSAARLARGEARHSTGRGRDAAPAAVVGLERALNMIISGTAGRVRKLAKDACSTR